MLISLFLAINLFPDYLIIAALVIVAHWFWLFWWKGRQNSQFSPLLASKMPEAPVGMIKPSQSLNQVKKTEFTPMGDDRDELIDQFESEKKLPAFQPQPNSNKQGASSDRIPKKEVDPKTQSGSTSPEHQKIVEKYTTGYSLLKELEDLDLAVLTPESTQELLVLAGLTRETNKTHSGAIHQLRAFFSEQSSSSTALPLIS